MYSELFLVLAEAQNKIGGPDYKENNSAMLARDIMRAIRARALGISSDSYLDGNSDQAGMREYTGTNADLNFVLKDSECRI